MPEVTLSLPLVLGLIILLLGIGAGVVYAALELTKPEEAVAAVPTGTATVTPTVTLTPTETMTPTLEPTWTPLPNLEYSVASGDTCLSIAYTFNVTPQSIILLNKLSAACDTLVVGQKLQIPQPTPTASPQPTSTLNPTEEAEAACEKIEYVVTSTDSLSGISLNYGVSVSSIREYNGLPNDLIYAGQKLKIPLCERGPQATPSATPIPPYAAPNLLLPADGTSFVSINDVITLQWASVGELRSNEAYAVTIIDASDTDKGKFVAYVTDTKLIVPTELRPSVDAMHIFRWSVLTVRQTGSDQQSGEPIWEPAGGVSAERVFGWVGSTGPAATPAP
ncbi:MAG: LysM peptidoglycan-binding domain-containing protein [Anaerolineae bacterium]|nr:LysM peptidoglycan-binding domain-containing protein [Anaerolineae bacterium]